jgi:hypothetical protein
MLSCTMVRARAGETWHFDAARVRVFSTRPSMTVRDDVVLPADIADSVTLFGCSVAQGSSYSRPNIG